MMQLKNLNGLCRDWQLVKSYASKKFWIRRIMEEVIPHYLRNVESQKYVELTDFTPVLSE